ncbi:MAG: DUF2842 domain-containing protein [Bradyrhizobiaceae bacterium]|nr:DUF2842 domain-containing protein [Bradyrhizobiaceae bacterium]
MSIRLRKLVGSLALLVLIAIWIALSMAFASAVFRFENPFLAFIYYVVAGIGWVLPAMPLVSWMLRRHPERP